jgi:hypothetical protein
MKLVPQDLADQESIMRVGVPFFLSKPNYESGNLRRRGEL